MSKITRSIEVELGGKVRKIKFTIGALEQLEANIPGRDVQELVQRGRLTITELVTATWCGLRTYDKKVSRNQAAEWVEAYNTTHPALALSAKILAAIGLSGIFGNDVSVFQDLLREADTAENDAMDETESPEE